MSNPWLKKNPFMSMWLSGANSVANSARGTMTAAAKRQSKAAATQASTDIFNFWAEALTGPSKTKKKSRR